MGLPIYFAGFQPTVLPPPLLLLIREYKVNAKHNKVPFNYVNLNKSIHQFGSCKPVQTHSPSFTAIHCSAIIVVNAFASIRFDGMDWWQCISSVHLTRTLNYSWNEWAKILMIFGKTVKVSCAINTHVVYYLQFCSTFGTKIRMSATVSQVITLDMRHSINVSIGIYVKTMGRFFPSFRNFKHCRLDILHYLCSFFVFAMNQLVIN